jgi:putative peptidoglycan lipid II flippase
VNILARGFYALGDTQTPMKISIVCLALNLVFAMLVVFPLRQAGLGLANSLSAIFNVGFLLYALRRKLKFLELGELRRNIAPLLVAATFAGIAAWLTSRYWEKSIGHENLAEKIGAVFVPMTLAAVIYFAIALLMKIPSAREIFNLVMEKLRLRSARK